MQTHFKTSAKRRYSFSCSEKFISSSCKVSSTEAAILCHVDRKTNSVKYNTMSNAYFQHGRICRHHADNVLTGGTTVVKLNFENDPQSKNPSKPVQLYFTEKRNI